MCFAYHVFHKQTSFIFKPEKYPMYFFSIMIHLMVISGCLCFGSTLSSHSSKFSARARRYIYLGYSIGIKGHKVLYYDTKTVFASRDVVFYESVFPFQSQTSSSSIDDPFVIPFPINDVCSKYFPTSF